MIFKTTAAALAAILTALSLPAVAADVGCTAAVRSIYSEFIAPIADLSPESKSLPTCAPGYKCRQLEFFDPATKNYPNAEIAPDPTALKTRSPAAQTRLTTRMKACLTCTAANVNGNTYDVDVTSKKGMRPGTDSTPTAYNFAFNWDHNNCRLNTVNITENGKSLRIDDKFCQGYTGQEPVPDTDDKQHPGFSGQKLQRICQAVSTTLLGGVAHTAGAPAGFLPVGGPPGFQSAPHSGLANPH